MRGRGGRKERVKRRVMEYLGRAGSLAVKKKGGQKRGKVAV